MTYSNTQEQLNELLLDAGEQEIKIVKCYVRKEDDIEIRDNFEDHNDEINDKDDFDEDACYERDIKWAESMCHDEIEDEDDFDEDAYYEQEIEMAEYMLEINEYYENNYAA